MCQGAQPIADRYIEDMKVKMLKVAQNEQDEELVDFIIKDIQNYVSRGDEEYTTMQQVVGMELIFKGRVMKN